MEIEAALDAWIGETKTQTKAMDRMSRPVQPTTRNLGVANTPSALATQTLIIPQFPAAGRCWYIHRVAILGADGHTSAVGLADVYAGPGQDAEATAQLYSGLAIPSIVIEGRFHNPVLPQEHVYAICYNLAAQQLVQFAIGVEEYPLESYTALSIG